MRYILVVEMAGDVFRHPFMHIKDLDINVDGSVSKCTDNTNIEGFADSEEG